jgi:hypothetical protein
MSRFNHNYNESGTTNIREALYLLGQNYKFVRLEIIREKNATPFFWFVFEGEDIEAAQLRYLKYHSCNIDFSKFAVLAEEIERYMKSREDYSI